MGCRRCRRAETPAATLVGETHVDTTMRRSNDTRPPRPGVGVSRKRPKVWPKPATTSSTCWPGSPMVPTPQLRPPKVTFPLRSKRAIFGIGLRKRQRSNDAVLQLEECSQVSMATGVTTSDDRASRRQRRARRSRGGVPRCRRCPCPAAHGGAGGFADRELADYDADDEKEHRGHDVVVRGEREGVVRAGVEEVEPHRRRHRAHHGDCPSRLAERRDRDDDHDERKLGWRFALSVWSRAGIESGRRRRAAQGRDVAIARS